MAAATWSLVAAVTATLRPARESSHHSRAHIEVWLEGTGEVAVVGLVGSPTDDGCIPAQ